MKSSIQSAQALAQKGVSLVELMISMILGSFVLAAALFSFHGTLMVDKNAIALTKLEETLRYASRVIRQDVEMAGFRGCAGANVPANVLDASKVGLTGVDAYYFNSVQTGVFGWEVPTSGTMDVQTKGLVYARAYSTEDRTPISQSDTISVQRGSFETAELNTDMQNGTSSIDLAPASELTLAVGDTAIIADCENVDFFSVTGVSASGIEHAAGPVSNTSAFLSKSYAADHALVMRYRSVEYFVGDTGRDDRLGNDIFALYRLDDTAPSINAGDELVEGVENLQVSYGQRLANGELVFFDANHPDNDFNAVEIIRFSIIASTVSPSVDQGSMQSFINRAGAFVAGDDGSGAITFGSDGRIRRTLTTSFPLRSRTPF